MCPCLKIGRGTGSRPVVEEEDVEEGTGVVIRTSGFDGGAWSDEVQCSGSESWGPQAGASAE